jgi:hypothetical protein
MGGGYCGVSCTSTCSSATASCVTIYDASGNVLGKNCVPTSGSCGLGTGGGSGGGGGPGTGGGSGTGGGGSSCTDTWSNYASAFFNSYCANCHGTEFSTQADVSSNAAATKSSISTGSMPPGGLSSSEQTRILNWFNCGMP